MEPVPLIGTGSGATTIINIPPAPQQAQIPEQGIPVTQTNGATTETLVPVTHKAVLLSTPQQPLIPEQVPVTLTNGAHASTGTPVPVTTKAEPLSTSPSPSIDEDEANLLNPTTLLRQINQLGPSERCSPVQAGNMGKKLLTIIAYHEQNNMPLPEELQSSFDILHRCLAVIYGTFFLNLYNKANAPCLLCHSCKCLYPPGQFIHHSCASLPPNIVPCRSRMWRRCLVPLVSPGMDKDLQKQRWKFVLEKFSHIAGRKNPIPPETEAQLLEIPELKRRRLSKPVIVRRGSEEEPKTDTGNGEINVLEVEALEDNLEAGSPVDASQSNSLSTPVALAEQLVVEVKRLHKEVALAKSKLQSATDVIGRMPSEACMREQLCQALTNQQSLTIERDQARDQARTATERADKLQKQLDLIRHTHAQMEKQFSV